MAVAIAFDPTERDAAGEVYNRCADVIRRTVRAFVRRHGGNEEDMFADSSMSFILGYQAWAAGRGNSPVLETEIARWVWYELFDRYRTEAGYRRAGGVRCKQHPDISSLAVYSNADGGHWLQEFIDELSEDAAVAARLVLEAPADIVRVAVAKGGTPRNFRSTLRDYLRGAGWAAERITEAFDEIERALA